MNTVFLDTVGLLAQWGSTDQWHDAADRWWSGPSTKAAAPPENATAT